MNFEVLIALRHSIFWAPDARFDIHYFVYLNDSGGAPRLGLVKVLHRTGYAFFHMIDKGLKTMPQTLIQTRIPQVCCFY